MNGEPTNVTWEMLDGTRLYQCVEPDGSVSFERAIRHDYRADFRIFGGWPTRDLAAPEEEC